MEVRIGYTNACSTTNTTRFTSGTLVLRFSFIQSAGEVLIRHGGPSRLYEMTKDLWT